MTTRRTRRAAAPGDGTTALAPQPVPAAGADLAAPPATPEKVVAPAEALGSALGEMAAGYPELTAHDQAVIEAITEAVADAPAGMPEVVLTHEELSDLHSTREFIQLLRSKHVAVSRIKRALHYEYELEALQIELVKMQRWVQEEGLRLAMIFEGRDAAGKGGTIRRFIEHLNPRAMRVVALPKPSDEETGQWYFQRYIRHLPNRGEVVFFDRSWYNRAVVEPVNGFCTKPQYEQFMRQVPEFEHMLVEDGVTLVKFWFSISRDVQLARFQSRKSNPLKQWKLSPLDQKAQDLWEPYTRYKEAMFSRTHTSYSPWIIVEANNKRRARLESIRYALSILDYPGKEHARVSLVPDPNVVMRFHRAALRID